MGVREEEKLCSERERNHGVRNRATICFASSYCVFYSTSLSSSSSGRALKMLKSLTCLHVNIAGKVQ